MDALTESWGALSPPVVKTLKGGLVVVVLGLYWGEWVVVGGVLMGQKAWEGWKEGGMGRVRGGWLLEIVEGGEGEMMEEGEYRERERVGENHQPVVILLY